MVFGAKHAIFRALRGCARTVLGVEGKAQKTAVPSGGEKSRCRTDDFSGGSARLDGGYGHGAVNVRDVGHRDGAVCALGRVEKIAVEKKLSSDRGLCAVDCEIIDLCLGIEEDVARFPKKEDSSVRQDLTSVSGTKAQNAIFDPIADRVEAVVAPIRIRVDESLA